MTSLKLIDLETCTVEELYDFCERMRTYKAIDDINSPKVDFWLGEELPAWVCAKNKRDFAPLLALYQEKNKPLGLTLVQLHVLKTKRNEHTAEYKQKLRDLVISKDDQP